MNCALALRIVTAAGEWGQAFNHLMQRSASGEGVLPGCHFFGLAFLLHQLQFGLVCLLFCKIR
jgi:hypothetical protein